MYAHHYSVSHATEKKIGKKWLSTVKTECPRARVSIMMMILTELEYAHFWC